MENENKFGDGDPTIVDGKAIKIEHDEDGTDERTEPVIMEKKYNLAGIEAAIEMVLDQKQKENPNFNREEVRQKIYFDMMEKIAKIAETK